MGAAVFPVCVAWYPMPVEAPAAMVLLNPAFVAVTCPLVGEYVAFQPLVMVCPDARENLSDQP